MFKILIVRWSAFNWTCATFKGMEFIGIGCRFFHDLIKFELKLMLMFLLWWDGLKFSRVIFMSFLFFRQDRRILIVLLRGFIFFTSIGFLLLSLRQTIQRDFRRQDVSVFIFNWIQALNVIKWIAWRIWRRIFVNLYLASILELMRLWAVFCLYYRLIFIGEFFNYIACQSNRFRMNEILSLRIYCSHYPWWRSIYIFLFREGYLTVLLSFCQ